MDNCKHYQMYFWDGRLTCAECGKNVTPLPNVRITVVQSGYRDNIIQNLQKIANEVPDDILYEIELYAEFLKSKRS